MELSDRHYVESCRDGSPDEFRLLVDRYQKPLFAFLSERLGNNSDAEEAAQDCFVRAFLSLKKLRKPDSFYAWLLGIAGRVLQEHFRTRQRFERHRAALESRSAFDTDWLHRIANLSDTIADELKNAQSRGWQIQLAKQTGTDGKPKAVVTIQTDSGLPENDYLKNKFMDISDTRRVYRFDEASEKLEAVQIFIRRAAGEVLVFELTSIDYNQPMDTALFQLQLPTNVNWHREMEVLPDNQKYASMSSEQAARAFFEACARQDWAEAAKFCPFASDDKLRQYLGGLEIVSIGESFTSQGYPGRFVPYEIKLSAGGVKKFNLALKKDKRTGRWFVDGGV